MPGFTTHIIVGKETLRLLPKNKLRRIIEKYPRSYALGLQGPDIYFYYPAHMLRSHFKNMGRSMHDDGVSKYIHAGVDIIKEIEGEKEQKCAIAYMAGFISHYICDAVCHPYIYCWIGFGDDAPGGSHRIRHAQLENQIDLLLLREYLHKEPWDYHPERFLPKGKEKKAVCEFIARCVNAVDEKKHGLSHWTARRMISVFRTAMRFRGLPVDCKDPIDDLLNLQHVTWKNPWNRSVISRKSFPELMEDAEVETLETFGMLNSLLESDLQGFEAMFYDQLDDRSLHHGFRVYAS